METKDAETVELNRSVHFWANCDRLSVNFWRKNSCLRLAIELYADLVSNAVQHLCAISTEQRRCAYDSLSKFRFWRISNFCGL